MMTEEIAALCRAMGAKEVQEELLLPLIQAVRDRLAGALKEGTAPEDCGPAFLLAAAMTVMDWLEDLEGGQIASFTAGDLTVRRERRDQGGRSLSEQAEELLSPWLRDMGFVFYGVEG